MTAAVDKAGQEGQVAPSSSSENALAGGTDSKTDFWFFSSGFLVLPGSCTSVQE